LSSSGRARQPAVLVIGVIYQSNVGHYIDCFMTT